MRTPEPIQLDETARADALAQARVLDSGPDTSFENMVELARNRFDTPIAQVSLLPELRKWFRASNGLAQCDTDEKESFCVHAAASGSPLALRDAREDPRLCGNSFVTGAPFVCAYLGVALITEEGEWLGTISVIDTKPREWSGADIDFMIRAGRLTAGALSNRLAPFRSDRTRSLELASNRYEARYRTVVATMMDGVVIQGPSGVIVDANPSATRILGLSEDQLYGRTSMDPRWRAVTADGDDLPGDRHPAMVALQTGQPQSNFIMGVHRPDGELRWILINSRPIEEAGGNTPSQVVTTFVDITEQRLRELDLANALKRARLAERAKSDFIDAMSHEVRTPLNGMLGVTQSLLRKDDTALPPRARSKVDLLHRSGLALKAIVDDALDISRLANDRLELTRSIYRPCVAVDDAARLYESMAQAKGVGFHAGIDIDPSLSALGDEVRVKQVLHNLLSNAVKFTASGAVGVAAHVETVTNRPEMVIVVRDTGIGVPAHFASRLGSSFARADNAAAAGASGAGLGLFLSREIAKRMGGRLDYAPNPGGGSAFEFRFPLELAESGPAATVPPPLQGLAPGLKVLVAEDNAMNQHVISLLLEQFDVDITFANNGAEGLKLAQSRRFDIALVDLYMPVMGGLELITQLRAWEADAQAPRTPIVCLSASVKDTSLRSVVDAGADAFVGKPIDFTEIVNVIREVTSKAATAH